MNVLHVIPSADIHLGGPVNVIKPMLAALISLGIRIALVATSPARGIDNCYPCEVKYPVYKFPSILGHQWGISPGCAKWLNEHVQDYDLVHIHSIFTFTTLATSHACQKRKVPYLIRPCGVLSYIGLHQKQFKKMLYMKLLERNNLNKASAIHCASASEAEAVSRWVPCRKVKIVPLGTAEPHLLASQATSPFESLKAGRKQPIVFMSRIAPGKGVELLIETADILRKRRSDFIFVICGSQNSLYERRLKKMIYDKGLLMYFKFLDFLDGPLKSRVLQDAVCFVLPSINESFGVSVIEAMACGAPVVISKQVGIAEQISASGAGLVVDCNPNEFANAVELLLVDPQKRLLFADRGKTLVSEKFRWEKVAPQIVDMYREILNEKGGKVTDA